MNKDAAAGSAQTGKPKKVKQHKILGIPFLAALILMFWGTTFYQTISGIGLLLTGSMVVRGLLGTLCGVLLILIHKAWFKPEYKGSVSLDFAKNRQYWIAIGAVLAVDVVLTIWGVMDYGFAFPTIATFATSLMAGCAEEAVFRDLIISTMMRKDREQNKYLPALITSAVLFGLTHLTNMQGGAALGPTLLQVIQSMILGLFLGALYLRTGSILPSMLYHFLHDFIAFMQSNQTTGLVENTSLMASDWGAVILGSIIEIVIAVWLLKGQKDNILAVWNSLWKKPEEA